MTTDSQVCELRKDECVHIKMGKEATQQTLGEKGVVICLGITKYFRLHRIT